MPKFIILNGETICETRDDESPPRKRQRVELDDEPDSYCAFKGPPVRDLEYYIEDGDCVLQVGHFLFKVQSSLFSPSLLHDMFRHHLEESGDPSDVNPLVLPASTDLREFRSLLWALYTNARETYAQATDDADVDRLLSVAAITHEYQFPALQSWAWSAIDKVTSQEIYIECCSSATFAHMIEVAILCEKTDVRESIISKWSNRIRRRAAPSVPAILFADQHELPALRGIAYHAYIQEIIENQTTLTDRGAHQLHVDPKLSNGQVMRLFSGYWSLVSFWERLRRNPPKILRSENCTSKAHQNCTHVWQDRWRNVAGSSRILAFSSSDVFSILSCMHDQLNADQELTRSVTAQCKTMALVSLRQISDDLYEGLADHFYGCV